MAARPSPHRSRDLILLCLLAGFLILPFADRPLHIDDPVYVQTAHQMLKSPFDFYGFHMNWEGHDQPVSQFCENPPLVSYAIALVGFFGGSSSGLFHLAFFVFNLLSVFGIYLLADRFCRRPFLAALVFLICPGFTVSATTLMCEPMLICLWIWARYLWIVGTDSRPMVLLGSGLLASAAVLTKFSAISLVPLLGLRLVLQPSPRRTRLVACLSLSLPIAIAIAYELFTAHHYGTGAFASAVANVAQRSKAISVPFWIRLPNTFCFLGGCAAPCLLLLPTVFPRRVTLIWLVLTAVPAVTAAVLFVPPEGWLSSPSGSHSAAPGVGPGLAFYSQFFFWMAGGAALGLLAALRLLSAIRAGIWRDELFLFVWATGVFCFAAFLNWSINARSILPMLPPICLIVFRSLDRIPALKRIRIGAALLLGTLLAIITTRADYKLAANIKNAALQLPHIARSDQSSPATLRSPVWFTGHWGFEYYMQAAGAQPVDDLSPQVKPGEIIIFPHGAYGGVPGGSGLEFVRRLQFGDPGWVSTSNVQLGAAFYCSYGFGLPFVFGPIPPEAFDIVRVTPQTRIHP